MFERFYYSLSSRDVFFAFNKAIVLSFLFMAKRKDQRKGHEGGCPSTPQGEDYKSAL
ncbi:MAG: hypothetical protein JXR90_14915 [Spirochaetes bacterium]|nr:hypothetical protein [Spirochaetota bacterium]